MPRMLELELMGNAQYATSMMGTTRGKGPEGSSGTKDRGWWENLKAGNRVKYLDLFSFLFLFVHIYFTLL